ncbi:MAG TPA: 2OG-Fe(II) oxygenase family protein, partial [Trichocoleus sp.]
MTTATCIPRLISPAVHPQAFAQQLSSALSEVGCAYVPAAQLTDNQNLLRTLETFFTLSLREKHLLAQQFPPAWQGVFTALGEEQLANSQEDHKETLDLNLASSTYARWVERRRAVRSHPPLSSKPANCPNPTSLLASDLTNKATGDLAVELAIEPIRTSLCQTFEAFQREANQVLMAIEAAYQRPAGSLVRQHGRNSTLRLLHYPPAPHFTLGSIRLGAHRDYSGITLLWQDSTGGLEILTPSGEWVAVDIPSGHIGVLVGEVTQRWSGNTLHSAPHRVRVANLEQLKQTRYSIAFFCETNPDCVVYPGSLLGKSGFRTSAGANPVV